MAMCFQLLTYRSPPVNLGMPSIPQQIHKFKNVAISGDDSHDCPRIVSPTLGWQDNQNGGHDCCGFLDERPLCGMEPPQNAGEIADNAGRQRICCVGMFGKQLESNMFRFAWRCFKQSHDITCVKKLYLHVLLHVFVCGCHSFQGECMHAWWCAQSANGPNAFSILKQKSHSSTCLLKGVGSHSFLWTVPNLSLDWQGAQKMLSWEYLQFLDQQRWCCWDFSLVSISVVGEMPWRFVPLRPHWEWLLKMALSELGQTKASQSGNFHSG